MEKEIVGKFIISKEDFKKYFNNKAIIEKEKLKAYYEEKCQPFVNQKYKISK